MLSELHSLKSRAGLEITDHAEDHLSYSAEENCIFCSESMRKSVYHCYPVKDRGNLVKLIEAVQGK